MEKRLIDRMLESRLAEKRKKQEEETAFHAYFEEQDRLGNFFEYSDIEKARESGDNELANYIQGLFESSRQACLRFDKEDPRYGKMPEKVGPCDLFDRILVNADEKAAPSNMKMETEQKEPPLNKEPENAKVLNHYFMIFLEKNYPETYKAMKSGLEKKCILFDGNKFNFLLAVGEVSHLFYQTGCTEAKEITQYILIKGKDAKITSLRNPKNYKIEHWIKVKKLLEL
jgi:hypothetical protein